MWRQREIMNGDVVKVPIRLPLDYGQPEAKGSKHLPNYGRRWIKSIGRVLGLFLHCVSFTLGLTPSRQPYINLRFERIDRTALQMSVPVDGQTFGRFPALHRTNGSLQVSSDLLPRVQMVSTRAIWWSRDSVASAFRKPRLH